MKKFTVTVSMEVSDNWIDDGFDLALPGWQEAIVEAFEKFLPHAWENEVKAEVLEVKSEGYEPMCQSCDRPDSKHFDNFGSYIPCIEQIAETHAAHAALEIDDYPGIDPVGPVNE